MYTPAMLFPYATTSHWKPWKRRVFAFKSLERLGGTQGNYEMFIPPCPAFPDHLAETGRMRFFDYCMAQKNHRIAQLGLFLSRQNIETSDPNDLDTIGDTLANLITAKPRYAKTATWPNQIQELIWEPYWNSILVDLALLLGALTTHRFDHLQPKWVVIEEQFQPFHHERFPLIEVSELAGHDDELSDCERTLQTSLARHLKETPSLTNQEDAWFDLLSAEVERLQIAPEKIKLAEFSSGLVLRRNMPKKSSYCYPFEAAKMFLTSSLEQKLLGSDNEQFSDFVPFALGDALRPETQPNWTTFHLA